MGVAFSARRQENPLNSINKLLPHEHSGDANMGCFIRPLILNTTTTHELVAVIDWAVAIGGL
jgi:hypothetical protein